MYYKYKVGWYNSYDDTEVSSVGIVFARDYSSAADHVQSAYDGIFDLYLKQVVTDDEEDYCLSKEELDRAFKED